MYTLEKNKHLSCMYIMHANAINNTPSYTHVNSYSLRFKRKVTFGYRLRYKIKVMCGEISLKLRQTNWNVAKNNVNVVVDELPSRITIYTCLINN
jgi:hypothetical protein